MRRVTILLKRRLKLRLLNNFKTRVAADRGVLESETYLDSVLTRTDSVKLLGKASLILTPNAYEEGKLYSVLPGNGNGDMTVVRGTTGQSFGTRENSGFLVEDTPYNLISFSEQFTNGVWLPNTTSIASTNNLAPNGSLTASRLVATTGVNPTLQQVITNGTIGTRYTSSFWVRRVSGTCQIYLRAGELNPLNINPTSEWQLFSATGLALTGATARCGIGFINPVIGTDIIEIWGAQLVQGPVAKPYFQTTNRLNVPRLEYDAVGGYPSILLEPQRTNVLLNSVWAGGGSMPTSWIAGFANSGTLTPTTSIKNPNVSAYRFVTTSTQRQEIRQQFALALNSITTFSVYVESVTTAIPINQMLRFSSVAGTGTDVFLKNNVVISGATNIEAGNTYSLQFTCTLSSTFDSRIGSGVNGAITGDITLSMPQLEQGAYTTSFIPTTTTALTRNGDVISKTGIGVDILNPSEGTFYAEISAIANDLVQKVIEITDGTDFNRVMISCHNPSNTLRLQVWGGGDSKQQTATVADITSFNKILIKWGTNGYFGFINGIKYTLLGSGSSPTALNRISFSEWWGGSPFNGRCKGLQIYKTALTDAECTSLTTL